MFENLINLLFPKKCSSCALISEKYICDDCRQLLEVFEPECVVCRKRSEEWSVHKSCRSQTYLKKVYYFYKYNTLIHNLILSIKYSFHKDKISEVLKLIQDLPEFSKIDFHEFDLLSFIPMSKKKQNWRGFNQTEIICKNFSDQLKIPYLQILSKFKNTKSQIDLSRDERISNLKSSFVVRKHLPISLTDEKILLIDDICTTGSTLDECAKTIKEMYPNTTIYGFCLARGDN